MQKKRAITIEDLAKFQFVSDPEISPDGSRILFARKVVNAKNEYLTQVQVVNRDGTGLAQWTFGEASSHHARWSPDGKRIAFMSRRVSKARPQIYLLGADGGEARPVTDLPEGAIGTFQWSPDGTKIAFSFRPQDPERTEAAKKSREEKGLSQPPLAVDDYWYRMDGDGYFGGQRFALHLLDLSSGKSRELYKADALGLFQFDWSPRSDELVVMHSACERPFAEKRNDQLYRVKLDGNAIQLPGIPGGLKSLVRWSPQGGEIAYLGNTESTEGWGCYNSRVFVLNENGSEHRCLTDREDFCFTSMGISDTKDTSEMGYLEWHPSGESLFVAVAHHGQTQLGEVSLKQDLQKEDGLKLRTAGTHCMSFGRISRDGQTMACATGDATHLDEIALLDLTSEKVEARVLTSFNRDLLNEIELATPTEHWVDVPGGTKLHFWMLRPRGFEAGKKYPMVLEIHGGPHAMYSWAFFHEFQLLAAQGYIVLYSNPRGSKGYGEDHCKAIRNDWGNADWKDLRALIDWAKGQAEVDTARMAVMGGSYGGYMTNWIVGHTTEFKSAITDRCVSNLISMGGSSDFPMKRDEYFPGAFYGDYESIRELWRQSPIAYFEKVQTPMLIIHSEGDLRCNIEQAEQVFTVLQLRGITSRFVRYPATTSHGMSRSGPMDLRAHRLREILAWYEKTL